jgi:hypothetical protein
MQPSGWRTRNPHLDTQVAYLSFLKTPQLEKRKVGLFLLAKWVEKI